MFLELGEIVSSFPEKRREAVRKMMDGPVGESFLTAPASSHLDYHACFPGGLLYHSLNVSRNVRKLAAVLFPGRWPDEKLAFVGLFHDLGKTGDGKNEHYIPNTSEWHRKRGKLYEINPLCAYMPTSERGLYLFQTYGVNLDNEEYLAIRLNDGQYVDENTPYASKEPDLALLVHHADHWSARQEKAEREPKPAGVST